MKNLWNDRDAKALAAHYAAMGVSRDLALRIYSTRLLGGEPNLVLHGGGNTSLKTKMTDLLGDVHEVLCVKGSGSDMAVIEPGGLPAVKLEALRKTRRLPRLSGTAMVALQRASMLDPGAPNPSVESLLHAFLPHKFVDHTHSVAVLSILDTEQSEALVKTVFGGRMGFVPYLMPGLGLAQAAADVFEANPGVEGLILDKHGIFTFGDTARQAYERMIDHVTLAETYLAANAGKGFASAGLPRDLATPAEIAPLLRGAAALDRGEGEYDRMICVFRTSDEILNLVNSNRLERVAAAGVPTPDLAIRVKNEPLVLPVPARAGFDTYGDRLREAIAEYATRYAAYFDTYNSRDDTDRVMLDPMPRLALVPGLGLFGLGRTFSEAVVSADIGQMWVQTVTGAEAIGTYRPATPDHQFDLEYWPPQLAKLAGHKSRPLTGQIVIVTGGGGAIGAATARAFAAKGAHTVVLDLDEKAAIAAAGAAGNDSIGLLNDVTDPASVRAAFDATVEKFGGVDIIVSNAGAAWQGEIAELDDALLRKSFELNFFSHQNVAQNAVRIFKLQGTGGTLLFNASKQAVNPGANFGAYGLPKAATLLLTRQYALEYGKIGVRANAVNADRIRSGLLTPEMIAGRSKARGLSIKDYMGGNLLGLEVTADHVAQAFVHHALAARTTADVTTVDGGNIAAAMR